MRRICSNDPVEYGYSLSSAVQYLLKSEVESFVSDNCPVNHIFVDTVITGHLDEANNNSTSYKIYELTEKLINNFNEDESDELIRLVNSYDDIEFLEDFE